MYDKFLFVGLGGSGGSTLGHLKQEIFSWLEEHGAEAKIPSGWQFLHIDTPVLSDSDPAMEEDEYLGLIPQGVGFAGIQGTLDGDRSLAEEMQTWRVDPAGNPVPVALGAGQFRAIGATVAAAYTEKIKEGVERKIALLKRTGANTEIAAVYSKATNKKAKTKNRVHVIVVSSLAGGTGAGIMTTVCDVLRATGEEGTADILGILYTPDVFNTLPPGQTKGVQPNSLAAIAELCNGYWWNGSSTDTEGSYLVPPKQSLLLKRAGLPHPGMKSGPSYPFLIGRESTGGIDHGTPQGLYSMVGRALLGWVTDIAVQQSFLREDIGNWYMASMGNETGPGSLFNSGAEGERGFPNVSSLGFARVTTGTDYFQKYAARRIVREALDHINRFHTGSVMAARLEREHGTQSPKDLARLIANIAHNTFMQSCNLSELGPDENNIIDALIPENHVELKEEFEKKALEFAQLESKQTRSEEQWREKILSAVEDSLPIYEAAYTNALRERSENWLAEIEDSVVKEVERSIATFGLMVTQESCKKAIDELRNAVSDELISVDYPHMIDAKEDWRDEVDTKLVGTSGKLKGSDSRLKTALQEGVHWAAFLGDALVAKRASVLAVEVAGQLLEPIANALEDAIDAAEAGQGDAGEWPAWSDAEPPDSVQPPKGVYALESPDGYNKRFEDLLMASTPPDLQTTTKDWIRELVITGSFLREQHEAGALENPDDILCVSVKEHEPNRAHWYPGPHGGFGELRNPRSLPATINVDISSLEKRALAWLNLPGSPFANFLNESLRSYLGSTSELDGGRVAPSQYRARRGAFVAAFAEAVKAGRPLINLDQDLLGNIHPNPPADKIIVSQLPFSGHVMKNEIRPVLAPVTGLPEGQIDKLFSTDDKIKHVDITTTLGAPHSVMVIESLMRPIVQDWGKVVTKGETQGFWSRRRARTIGEFTPAPQALIYCLVRGWFTGVLLGRIDRVDDGSRAATIGQEGSDGKRGRTEKFPHPYLSTGAGLRDRLPQVLEALCLALVGVSLKGTVEPLAAYCVLRDLGRSEPGSHLYPYPDLHPDLKRWVDSGTVNANITDPMLQADEDATSADRVRILVELLEKQMDDYHKLYSEEQHRWEMSPIAISGPPLWTGISTYIMRELSLLRDAAVRYEIAVGQGNQVL